MGQIPSLSHFALHLFHILPCISFTFCHHKIYMRPNSETRVYAMMSIGVLGFVVWSQVVMALLCCEAEVINLTVSWKGFMPIDTFNSENSMFMFCIFLFISLYTFIYGLTASAGNLTGSSETTREKSYNFSNFHTVYKNIYGKTIDEN